MFDFDEKLRILDSIEPPDLWQTIQTRAAAREPLPRVRTWRRLAPAAAVALIALVALIVTVLPRPGSAFAIVEKAIHDFGEIPSFHATIIGRIPAEQVAREIGAGRARERVYRYDLWYRDRNGWRLDVLEDSVPVYPQGGRESFWIWDGAMLHAYNATTKTFFVASNVVEGFSPLGLLSWDAVSTAEWKRRCSDSAVLADSRIAGRIAQHVRCGEIELWIDAETGLMLKIASREAVGQAPKPVPGPISFGPGTTVEIQRAEYRPPFPEGLFEFVAPSGATESSGG